MSKPPSARSLPRRRAAAVVAAVLISFSSASAEIRPNQSMDARTVAIERRDAILRTLSPRSAAQWTRFAAIEFRCSALAGREGMEREAREHYAAGSLFASGFYIALTAGRANFESADPAFVRNLPNPIGDTSAPIHRAFVEIEGMIAAGERYADGICPEAMRHH